MATQLNLEEQEQLDELKHFWKQWGNLITWVAIAVLGTYAAWNARKLSAINASQRAYFGLPWWWPRSHEK